MKNSNGTYITGDEFSTIRIKAIRRGLPFEIDIKYIEKLFVLQKMKCKLSGVPISFNSKRNKKVDPSCKRICGNASIDRIDSKKGYVKGNIQIVDKYVNFAKNELTQKQFIRLCRNVVKTNEVRTP